MVLPSVVAQGLSVPFTPLIGRERDVDSLCALIRRDDVRLVTLIGPGGVGKTRLALAASVALASYFVDGVRHVSLGAIEDANLVGPTIAHALGIRETGDRPIIEQLTEFLGQSAILLLLDSVERAAEDASLLTSLLADCPGLKILATSRRVLHLSAEHLYAVPPLGLPAPGEVVPAGDVANLDAIRLFTIRARAASAGFELSAANAADIVEICLRLDGLPLAIELAAARVRLFAPATMLARLDRRLPFLTDGPKDVPARHRTLFTTISWSYELLQPAERQTLRHLAIFAGGFALDAAMRVVACDERAIMALVDQSLLHRTDATGDESRFAMLDTVREFALDRLAESGELEELRRRHAEWCLELVALANDALGSAEQRKWLHRLDSEHDNLRAAMYAARSSGDTVTLARLAGRLWLFWYGRGYFTEGRLWVEDALVATTGVGSRERVDLLIGAGTMAHAQGDEQRATALADNALELARQGQDRRGLALALNLRGVVARDHGEYDRALVLLEESQAHSRAVDHPWGIVLSTNSLAILHQLRGDYDQASSNLQEGAEIARSMGDNWSTAQALSNMAHLSRRQGDVERAAALYEESGALYREVGDRRGEANSLTNLGRMLERLGEIDRAIILHGQSLEASRLLGDRRGVSTVLANLGAAYLRKGDTDLAQQVTRESLVIRHSLGDREGVSTSLEKLAEVAAAKNQPGRALLLWAAAGALRDAIGAPLAPSERSSYEVVITAARASLSPDRVAAIWAEGRSLSLERAVELAVREDAPPEPSADVAPAVAVGASVAALTPREFDVLRLLEVHTDREIAERLFIGPRTVATHVTSILNKLGVNTRTAAVAHAIRHGYI